MVPFIWYIGCAIICHFKVWLCHCGMKVYIYIYSICVYKFTLYSTYMQKNQNKMKNENECKKRKNVLKKKGGTRSVAQECSEAENIWSLLFEGFSYWVPHALWLVVLAVFGAVDWPHAPCMSVHFCICFLNSFETIKNIMSMLYICICIYIHSNIPVSFTLILAAQIVFNLTEVPCISISADVILTRCNGMIQTFYPKAYIC